jgi:hypothetical protein
VPSPKPNESATHAPSNKNVWTTPSTGTNNTESGEAQPSENADAYQNPSNPATKSADTEKSTTEPTPATCNTAPATAHPAQHACTPATNTKTNETGNETKTHLIRQLQQQTWRESLALRYQIRIPTHNWHQRAACRGLDIDFFYAETGLGTKYAAEICRTCPVILDCGAAAWDEEIYGDYTFGTRAGMPANARKHWYSRLKKQAANWAYHPSWR